MNNDIILGVPVTNAGDSEGLFRCSGGGSSVNIQSSKSITITPGSNYSGAYTTATTISPDSGYDVMGSVSVQVPMIRDYEMLQYSTTNAPGTIYKGDTSYSNSKTLIRVKPYKNGMIYTGSYLYVDPSEWNQNLSSINYSDGYWSTTSQYTYTFSQNLKECFVGTLRNSTSYSATYTGTGSMTTYTTNGNYLIIYKITNVKSGDTFKCPTFSVGSGGSRSCVFVLGVTS